MSTLLAKNAEVLVTMDSQRRELKNAGLYVEDGFIKQVGPNEELPVTADTVLDLSGQIVLGLPDSGCEGSRCALPRQPRLDVPRPIPRRAAAGRLRRGRGLYPQGQRACHQGLSRHVPRFHDADRPRAMFAVFGHHLAAARLGRARPPTQG